MSGSKLLDELASIVKRLQCNQLLRRSWSYLDEFLAHDNIRTKTLADALHITEVKEKVITDWGIVTDIKKPFKIHQLISGPSTHVRLTMPEAKRYYTQMQLIRHIDTATKTLQMAKSVHTDGRAHDGQEACAVGMRAAMRDNDCVIMGHRPQNWAHLMGVTPHQILAELAGKKTGVSRGRGGLVYTFAPQFYGVQSKLGSQVPMGAGIAFASKYRTDGGTCLTIYQPEEAFQDAVIDAFHMAAVWRLPCIFVCETNDDNATQEIAFYKQGDYMPGIWVDGKNVLAVRSATQFAINYALRRGPIILQLDTSSPLEDANAEDRKLLSQYDDPVTNFRRFCIEGELFNEREVEEIDVKVSREVYKGMKQAKDDMTSGMKELTSEVYANSIGDDHTTHKWFHTS